MNRKKKRRWERVKMTTITTTRRTTTVAIIWRAKEEDIYQKSWTFIEKLNITTIMTVQYKNNDGADDKRRRRYKWTKTIMGVRPNEDDNVKEKKDCKDHDNGDKLHLPQILLLIHISVLTLEKHYNKTQTLMSFGLYSCGIGLYWSFLVQLYTRINSQRDYKTTNCLHLSVNEFVYLPPASPYVT